MPLPACALALRLRLRLRLRLHLPATPDPDPDQMAMPSLFSFFFECYNEFDAQFDAVAATTNYDELRRREVMLTFMLGILPVQGPRAFNSDLPDDIFRSIAAHLPRPTKSLICFGVSGAGKSAFLARLLSRLDPSGFKAALPKNSIVSIEGVNVGGTIGSTTLVPVMYNVGGELQIFDVPGFKDTDEERQVVINILHKCLLTRVQVRPRVLLNVAPIGWCNG